MTANTSQQVLFIHPKTKDHILSHYIHIPYSVYTHITSFVHKKNRHKNVNLCIQKKYLRQIIQGPITKGD